MHRDVKPGNIILVRDRGGAEVLKLVDFGIAQLERPPEGKLTIHGAIIGTPEYMAPEQLLATGEVDHLSDVYAVGITIYECIAGRVPFIGNYQQVLLQVGSNQPAPPLVSLAPIAGARLSMVVDKAISKDRAKRYQSVEELARDLATAIPGARRRTMLFVQSSALAFDPMLGPPSAASAIAHVQQRRKAVRANYATPVHVDLPSGGKVDGRSEDVSTGGMLIILNDGTEIPQGEPVMIRFALPMEGKVIACTAVVRWVRATQGRRAMGVEFADVPAELTSSVARYIELMGVPRGD